MHTKNSLIDDIKKAGIQSTETLLIHSSMKSIGEVKGGADTVLDAFIEYMADGLLLFPTHSWSSKSLKDGIFNPKTEPSCVGILTNLFMKRENCYRSMHPTHSVAAMGKRASSFVKRDNGAVTPCPKGGCFSALYDEDASILFLGAPLTTNTFIHSVEEKLNLPNRISEKPRKIKIVCKDGKVIDSEIYPHSSTKGDVSQNYGKLLSPMLKLGIAKAVKIGDANSYLVKVRPMADFVTRLLTKDPNLFDNDKEIEESHMKTLQ
ncbi:MAG TPA: AAC(3) family N-acetyltransferase [Oscillospiraceae bacterium]|nr:AAC(3) family N-acetyltransferase [Oscillospiraceae bacterium]